jgi:hypothetical protein
MLSRKERLEDHSERNITIALIRGEEMAQGCENACLRHLSSNPVVASRIVKTVFVVVGLFLLAVATARPQGESQADGVIYGIVLGQDGKPAKSVWLAAWPDMPLGGRLPYTKSNDAGEYRFEHLPWWGKWSICAEDGDAGYSAFVTAGCRNDPPWVEVSPQHREAQLKVYLPPKAGFLHIHLTNRKTGAEISGMEVVLTKMESPKQLVLTTCYSNHVVLVPPDQNLVLHVKSDGYREWVGSARRGKPLNLASGARLTLDIQLDPLV